MRAVAVRAFRAAPERIEIPRPEVGSGEVGVRVQAAGMNPFDAKIADGVLDGHRPHRFPLVLGTDGAGVVDSIGPDVHRFRVGDRIFGQFLHDPVGIGTYAEFSTTPESIGVTQVPTGLSATEAAALPTAGMTALHALDLLGLSAGEWLLIVGASGGVGSFATQFAHAQGLHVIAAVRPDAAERSRRLGADETVDVGPGLPAAVAALRPGAVDGLLDLMSPAASFGALARLVRPGGKAATTIWAADPASASSPGVAQVNVNLQPSAPLLERAVQLVASHRLAIPVERRIPLDDAPTALAEIRAGHARGKTVIDL